MRKLLLLLVVGVFILILASVLFSRPSSEDTPDAGSADADADLGERRGALVDEVVFTQESDAGKVAGLIEAGSHHVFAQGVTNTTAYHRLRDSQQATYEEAYGTSSELTLNPAGPELANGELNPFAVKAIREAMNWLVNRRHIAEELYGGLAVPRALPVNTAFPDYARLADTARALELEYGHNPDRARRVIREEMEALGGTLENGRWIYNDRPVRLIALIRSEDARKRVGDYVANLLEDEGFRVERQYRTAEEASRIWIGSDPAGGRWHVYTGSWISTVINRDVSDNFSFYYTPRGRPDPLWQAYDPDPELDEIADRLQRRDYATSEERQEMMARGMELAMKDSARIWLVDQTNILPHAANVELAADLAGGVAGSRLWPYTLRFRDRVGGRIVFAAPSLLTEPWNPVAGSNWLFDTMITRALSDDAVLPDPFTGLYWPQRIQEAEVTVQAGVPVEQTHDWLSVVRSESIQVPEDAWIDWDGEAGRFITVGEKHEDGVTARTRTRVRYEDGYLERRWHDGSTMSVADVVLPWILTFARADEESSLFDPSHVPLLEVFQRHFRGWRITSTDPLTIEIYSDQIYPDAETIVAQRVPSAQPWHTLALGILAERGGELAFSSDKADRLEVDWMSLVAGPSLNVLKRALELGRENDFVPYADVLGEYLGEDEARERYTALADWYAQRNHFWVGDGPFYLHAVYPVERTVVLRRYEDFPDPADKWLRFTRPRIPEVNLDGPMMVHMGDEASFRLDITFEGEPYPEDAIDEVQYLLFDGDGQLHRKGKAALAANGQWRIDLDSDELAALGTGANSLEVAVTSRDVALPAFVSHAFGTVPAGTATLEQEL
ncbi:ABC transporter substrate-binding protein [Aquisalimonas sp.]|uniref:ABC transporter substrate-binding protein n=1 Tax=Aquisalimonas sp. TaxID=1872621 RepID=UPI0025BD7B88|nr:ABC transporter substrate-binding protein [Aquisalimonas sp.]